VKGGNVKVGSVKGGNGAAKERREREKAGTWPLLDISITNIVWCMAYKREVVGGVVYCAIYV